MDASPLALYRSLASSTNKLLQEINIKTSKRCKERILKVTFVTLNLIAAFTSCFKESLSLCRNPASTHLIAMVTFPPVCLGQQEWEVHGSDADSHLDLGFTF
jgi:hypothetical protein